MLKYYLFAIFCNVVLFAGCSSEPPVTKISIIPKPQLFIIDEGSFNLNNGSLIVYMNEELKADANYLAEEIRQVSGLTLFVRDKGTEAPGIILKLNKQIQASEGYSLKCTPNSVSIEGKTIDGAFYGIQSLLQLLSMQNDSEIFIPAVEITDQPRYRWRGMHLDVSRHFFPPEFIRKMLDMMAMHKMNVFHWHLTDDQGWRIEIKKYPKLTETGAWRQETKIGHMADYPHRYDGQLYGGFYTQSEIKAVVEYAKTRHITILPEIEMPGHAQAAVAAYPELSCFPDSTLRPWTLWGISNNIFCAGKEKTFQFMEDVLSEVCDLFPGEYIHVGGDECPKDHWRKCPLCQKQIKVKNLQNENELQSYFIQRIEHFLASKGKKLIGWDEILEGGLAERAAVMSWRGEEGGIEAASMGHKVVMTPGDKCYFDQGQSFYNNEPQTNGKLSMEEVYNYNPTPELLPEYKKTMIIGTQANIWTEYLCTEEQIEYMMFPRLSAISEVLWTNPENKNYVDFVDRMSRHYLRLATAGVNFRLPVPEELPGIQIFDQENIEFPMKCEISTARIHYTTDGTEPNIRSAFYTTPIKLNLKSDLTLKAASFLSNDIHSKTMTSLLKSRNFTQSKNSTLKSGLTCTKFVGPFRSFTEVGGTEELRIITPNFSIPEIASDTMSGWELKGYLIIDREGEYHFELTSACGSGFYIGDELVIDNDGFHYDNTRYGKAYLKTGLLPVRLIYFNTIYGCLVSLKYKGPDISLNVIPKNKLFH